MDIRFKLQKAATTIRKYQLALKVLCASCTLMLIAPFMMFGIDHVPNIDAILLPFSVLWLCFGLLYFGAFYVEIEPKPHQSASSLEKLATYWSIGFEWFAMLGFISWFILGLTAVGAGIYHSAGLHT
ncbi:hypothetical protein ACMXYV_07615 [Neptuniibacter sp. SY11_33]|uniref:hypothetical protein n=1 Tax=Neptuniibacter sp. SY11_33 TaxID=3398215 RepID=UPI0039F5C9B9